jgi:hypothetical protein
MLASTDRSFDAFEGLLVGIAGGALLWLSIGAAFWLLHGAARLF